MKQKEKNVRTKTLNQKKIQKKIQKKYKKKKKSKKSKKKPLDLKNYET